MKVELQRPTDREKAIYNRTYDLIWNSEEDPNDIHEVWHMKVVAREYGISVEDVDEIYMKCGSYGAMIDKPYGHLLPAD